MNLLNGIAIIIPAYQPSPLLLTLVQAINPEHHLIIVNDGSSEDSTPLFQKLATLPQVTVLQHAVNLGKGQALKTAFRHYLTHFSEQSPGVVTADADGQHSPEDIQKIALKLQPFTKEIILGSRQFDHTTPFKSRFGNTLSAKIFKMLLRKPLQDTQTGLRGISRSLVSSLLEVQGSRYEYELSMLMYTIKNKISIIEVPIKTIYIDNNKSSHFNPIIDSLKVYFVFFRYILGSLSSACVDFLCFTVIYFFTQQLFISVASARVISGVFNFSVCKKLIFKSKNSWRSEFVKYVGLAIFSMLLSYVLIRVLNDHKIFNVYYAKLFADVGIFVMNFTIQRFFIFSLKRT